MLVRLLSRRSRPVSPSHEESFLGLACFWLQTFNDFELNSRYLRVAELKQTSIRSDAHADARRLASRVLLELDLAGIISSPRMFELFHAHLAGGKPDLTRDVQALLVRSSRPKPEALEALYTEHFARAADEVQDSADALRQEAHGLIEDVSAGGEHLQHYGQILRKWSAELTDNRSVDSLFQAVETLTAETARASERNRELEQQLSAATARVARLRDSLVDVKREATTDGLTGLCNRKAFDSRLRRSLSAFKSDNTAVSVLLLDVDHFKRVNDTFGHQVGDLVLRLIGRLLTESVKGRDTAARYGGEEFAIILAGTGIGAARIVAEQVRVMLASKRFGGKGGSDAASVTISIGISQARVGDTGAALVGRADEALYRAKATGRNRVCDEAAVAV